MMSADALQRAIQGRAREQAQALRNRSFLQGQAREQGIGRGGHRRARAPAARAAVSPLRRGPPLGAHHPAGARRGGQGRHHQSRPRRDEPAGHARPLFQGRSSTPGTTPAVAAASTSPPEATRTPARPSCSRAAPPIRTEIRIPCPCRSVAGFPTLRRSRAISSATATRSPSAARRTRRAAAPVSPRRCGSACGRASRRHHLPGPTDGRRNQRRAQ